MVKDLFAFRPEGRDAAGRVAGRFVPTGHAPAFLEELVALGYRDAPALFRRAP
ncbi:MAG: hypothetical protein MUC63_10995 [Planctomycetes bacterium]|nr:hypothetical protein [Planctomycetota bacterium]